MRGVWVATVVLGAVLLAGCGGGRHPVVSVTPRTSLEDQPVAIRVTGLPPGRLARVVLRSTDARGVRWMSAATFRADSHGAIDLTRSSAIAGSYRGVWGMGLVASLTTRSTSGLVFYYWHRAAGLTFRLDVTAGGKTVASTSFERRFGATAASVTEELPTRAGFYGAYFAPRIRTDRPSVLLFGGSEGGLSTYLLGAALAAHGYPALALAYFKQPGLPQTLQRIPLEYFAGALRWLARRPHVDRSKLVVLGISRGSEAAELLGVHYPSLVHAVVVGSPSDVALCGLTAFDACGGPAWTFRGKPLPYTGEFDDPAPDDVPDAVIPVERIHGPMFLVCGEADGLWTSCPYARAMVARLVSHHSPYRHELDEYSAAGHPVGGLLPDEPGYSSDDPTAVADEQAREQVWPRVLRFLAAIGP